MEVITSAQLAKNKPNPIFIYHERHSGQRVAHRHDFFEIAFVREGTGTQVTIGGEQSLAPGDVTVITPAAWHGLSEAENLRLQFCCFSPSVLRGEIPGLLENAAVQALLSMGPTTHRGFSCFHLPAETMSRCLTCVEAIAQEAGGWCEDGNASLLSGPNRATAYWKQVAHLILILAELSECQRVQCRDNRVSPAIREVVERIADDPARDYTLADLSSIACLESSYFIRRFSREVGVSPMRYLFQVRIQLAAEMLMFTDKPIYQIAEACGFPQPTHFSMRFREYYHASPAEYRRQFEGLSRSTLAAA